MSTGAEFRHAYRRAQADLRKAQRNKRGKRPRSAERADYGRVGFRREPPRENGTDQEPVTGIAAAHDCADPVTPPL